MCLIQVVHHLFCNFSSALWVVKPDEAFNLPFGGEIGSGASVQYFLITTKKEELNE